MVSLINEEALNEMREVKEILDKIVPLEEQLKQYGLSLEIKGELKLKNELIKSD